MTQVCDLCNGFGYTVTIPEQELNPDGTENFGKEEICEDCYGKGKLAPS